MFIEHRECFLPLLGVEGTSKQGQNWAPSDRIRQAACLVAVTGEGFWSFVSSSGLTITILRYGGLMVPWTTMALRSHDFGTEF